VPVLARAEAAWVLATVYELSASDLAKAIEMLLHHRDLVLQDVESVSAPRPNAATPIARVDATLPA
jgi:hypothetical protein